jgi:hypothetical protein
VVSVATVARAVRAKMPTPALALATRSRNNG